MPRATRMPEPTALRALLDSYTVPQLKPLAGLLEPRLPTRKFELLDRVTRHRPTRIACASCGRFWTHCR